MAEKSLQAMRADWIDSKPSYVTSEQIGELFNGTRDEWESLYAAMENDILQGRLNAEIAVKQEKGFRLIESVTERLEIRNGWTRCVVRNFCWMFCLTVLIGGCASAPTTAEKNSPFTHGNVQLSLKQGVTSQAEVLEKFGPPNIATIDGAGHEVWSYQKMATVSRSSSSGVFGTVVVLSAGSNTSGFEQSSRTMTLIIKFDSNKKVSDFKSMSSSF